MQFVIGVVVGAIFSTAVLAFVEGALDAVSRAVP